MTAGEHSVGYEVFSGGNLSRGWGAPPKEEEDHDFDRRSSRSGRGTFVGYFNEMRYDFRS